MDRRAFINLLTTAGIAAPVAAATAKMIAPKSAATLKAERNIAERILDTRQIRCAYINYAPAFMKDPNTGKMSGIFYDLTEKVGELAGFDIKWDVETTFATFADDLRYAKYDLYGGGIWPDTKRATIVDFSMPTFYSGLGVYVRADDHRFDGKVNALNTPDFRIAAIDGEMSQIVQQSDFPKASVLGLPNNTDISMLAESLIGKKADATIIEKAVANLYMKKNPGALRNLTDAKPIRILENAWAYAYGSDRLDGIMTAAIKEMLYSGYVEKVLEKYEGVPGSFYRMRAPIE